MPEHTASDLNPSREAAVRKLTSITMDLLCLAARQADEIDRRDSEASRPAGGALNDPMFAQRFETLL